MPYMQKLRADIHKIGITMTAGNPYEGTEFWRFRHGLEMLRRLQAAALDVDLVWVLPEDVFAGAEEVYGLRVIRADVPAPLLAHFTIPADD